MTDITSLREKIAERMRLRKAGATPEEVDAHWRGDTPEARGYTFHAYVYNLRYDMHEWRGYTRESLLDHLMRSRRLRYIRRPTEIDVKRVEDAWRMWWVAYGQSVRLAETLGLEHVRTMRGDTLRDLISAVSPPVSAVGASIRETSGAQNPPA